MLELSDSESVTLDQQRNLERRLGKTVKREKMEDGAALSKLLEMIITNQKESDSQNRDLIERLHQEKTTMTHSFDGIDLTGDKHVTYPKMTEGESMTTYLAKLEYSFALNKTK